MTIDIGGRIKSNKGKEGYVRFRKGLNEAKRYFSKNIVTSLVIDSNVKESSSELIPKEFLEKLGQYIFNNLAQHEIQEIIYEPNILYSPSLKKFHGYKVIYSTDFQESEERESLFRDAKGFQGEFDFKKEEIKKETFIQIGRSYLRKEFSKLGENGIHEIYPELKKSVEYLWEIEAYKKSILPFLEKNN